MTREEALIIAHRYVSQEVGAGFRVDEQYLQEESGVFVFTYQTQRYLDTRHWMDQVVGGGPVIIDKEDGAVTPFGSAHSRSSALQVYEQGKAKLRMMRKVYPGFELYNVYDLAIVGVYQRQALVEILLEARLSYVKPELEGGTIWRIRKYYQAAQLEAMLETLPTVFMLAGDELLDLYLTIRRSGLAEVRLTELP